MRICHDLACCVCLFCLWQYSSGNMAAGQVNRAEAAFLFFHFLEITFPPSTIVVSDGGRGFLDIEEICDSQPSSRRFSANISH